MTVHIVRPHQVEPGTHTYQGIVCHSPTVAIPGVYRRAVDSLIAEIGLQVAAIADGTDPGGLRATPTGDACDPGSVGYSVTISDTAPARETAEALVRSRATLLQALKPADR